MTGNQKAERETFKLRVTLARIVTNAITTQVPYEVEPESADLKSVELNDTGGWSAEVNSSRVGREEGRAGKPSRVIDTKSDAARAGLPAGSGRPFLFSTRQRQSDIPDRDDAVCDAYHRSVVLQQRSSSSATSHV